MVIRYQMTSVPSARWRTSSPVVRILRCVKLGFLLVCGIPMRNTITSVSISKCKEEINGDFLRVRSHLVGSVGIRYGPWEYIVWSQLALWLDSSWTGPHWMWTAMLHRDTWHWTKEHCVWFVDHSYNKEQSQMEVLRWSLIDRVLDWHAWNPESGP